MLAALSATLLLKKREREKLIYFKKGIQPTIRENKTKKMGAAMTPVYTVAKLPGFWILTSPLMHACRNAPFSNGGLSLLSRYTERHLKNR